MVFETYEKVGRGNSVAVYRMPQDYRGPSDGSYVVRVPHSLPDDAIEISQLESLQRHFDPLYLPEPRVEQFEDGGQKRRLVVCREIRTPLITQLPSRFTFARHLDGLGSYEEKVEFLANLRGFLDSCKAFYHGMDALPDLAGRGNFIPDGTRVYLLDFNNIGNETAGDHQEGVIHVPVDRNGNPVFDLSLHLMYRLEKRMLFSHGGNFSTQDFNRYCRAERGLSAAELSSLGVFTSPLELMEERIYGALRFRDRREEVERIAATNTSFH